MATHNWVSREIKKGLKIAVEPTEDPAYLNQPVWAINWFNLNRKWLYDLYTLFAAKFVAKVGGQLLFKGYLVETISDDAKLARHMLLIVRYPDIHHFLNLILIRSFQLISVLRLGAVKEFSFGFMRKLSGNKITKEHYKLDKQDVYLVHHFVKGDEQSKDALPILAKQHEVELVFLGTRTGIIYKQTADKNTPTPFFMDGISLIKASNRTKIDSFIGSLAFKEHLDQNTSNYLGILQREK